MSGLYITDLATTEKALAKVAKQCQDEATNKCFKVVFRVMDVREEVQVDCVVNHAKETFGRIDYAANIAGVIFICSLVCNFVHPLTCIRVCRCLSINPVE